MSGISGKGDRSLSSHKSKEDKDRKKSYMSMIPISCYKVKEVIYEKLIMHGQLPLFKHLMRERLYQTGWVYAYRLACQEQIKKLGVENVNVSHMMTDMLPTGRDLFNSSEVRQQLHNLLRDFALMYFNSDPSALLPSEYSSGTKNDVQYQGKDARPEPRKRTHSHDHNVHSHNSKRSRSRNRSCRSRSRNRSNRSRSRSRSQRGRSSSGSGSRSGSHSGSRSRSPVRSPMPPRPITPQPPVLPPVLRVERVERVERAERLERLERVTESKPAKLPPKPRKPPPIVEPPPPPRDIVPIKEEPINDVDDDDDDSFDPMKLNEEEEEELPDI